MKSIRANIGANVFALTWGILLNLLTLPILLRLLGVEAYGLVGFFATLQAALALLDLGLSPTMARQIAVYSTMPHLGQETRDFVRTIEVLYWSIGIIIGVGIFAFSGVIAAHWLKSDLLSESTVHTAVVLMGLVAASQWPASLYAGGLQGQERQVNFNIIYVSANTLRYMGAIALLLLWANINVYFVWQLVLSLAYVAALALSFWTGLPAGTGRTRVRPRLLLIIRTYALGLTGIALISFIQSQFDKVVLSGMMPLEQYAYYALATVVSQAIISLTAAVGTATFPRFARFATSSDSQGMSALYHQASQLLVSTVVILGVVIAFFPHETMLVLTRNPVIADNSAQVLTVLVASAIVVALATLPYRLALASGWTSLNLKIGIAAVALTIPLTLMLTKQWGAVGAASALLIVNAAQLPFYVVLVHRRLLKGHLSRWALNDVLIPLFAGLIIVVIARLVIPESATVVSALLRLAAVTALAVLGAGMVAGKLREVVVSWIMQFYLSQTHKGRAQT